VLVGLITSVISIYYYIRVIKMMVVKEPQEMSDAVKDYPEIRWNVPGLRPMQVSLILAVVALPWQVFCLTLCLPWQIMRCYDANVASQRCVTGCGQR
jgi:NADH:ubiquinone oxidoreductase subunit 2 (subunit N)